MNDIAADSDSDDSDIETGQIESRWDIVDRTHGDDADDVREALGRLLKQYLPVLGVHLRTKWGVSENQSDDVVQDFALKKILQGDLFRKADRSKGRLRTFLYTAIDNFFVDELRKQGREPNQHVLDSDPPRDGTAAMDAVWAQALITSALRAMRDNCERQGATVIWNIFYHRIIAPLAYIDGSRSFQQLANENQLDSAAVARNRLETGKRQFRKHLLRMVRETVANDEDVEDELKALSLALADAARSASSFDEDSSIVQENLSSSVAWDSAIWSDLSIVSPGAFQTLVDTTNDDDRQRFDDELHRTLGELADEEQLLQPGYRYKLSSEEFGETVLEALTTARDNRVYRLIMRLYSGRLMTTPSKTSLILYVSAVAAALNHNDEYIGLQPAKEFRHYVDKLLNSSWLKNELRQPLLDVRARLAQP